MEKITTIKEHHHIIGITAGLVVKMDEKIFPPKNVRIYL